MLIIEKPALFSFQECYRFLTRSANELSYSAENNQITKLLTTETSPILFQLSEHKNTLEINFLNQSPNQSTINTVKDYITDWLHLDANIQPFYIMSLTDPILHPLTQRYRGLRLIAIPDLFEALTWAIIGQQINLTFAYTLKKRFIEHFGQRYEHQNQTHFTYPEYQDIHPDSYDALMKLQFSKQKATYIIGVAKAMQQDKLSKKSLAKLSHESAISLLCQVKGVGNWTAQYVMMKCLRSPNAFPIEDVGLHNAIKNQLGLPQKPTIHELKQLSQNWEGHQAYATFYLWRSLLSL